jgi:hypothetical protein
MSSQVTIYGCSSSRQTQNHDELLLESRAQSQAEAASQGDEKWSRLASDMKTANELGRQVVNTPAGDPEFVTIFQQLNSANNAVANDCVGFGISMTSPTTS